MTEEWKKHYILPYMANNNGDIISNRLKKIINGRILNQEKIISYKYQTIFAKNIIYECFNGKIPDNHYIVYNDGIINNLKISNLKLVNKEQLKEYKQEQLNNLKADKICDGWYAHYKFLNYLGNKEGQIFSIYNNIIINGHNTDGYDRINIHDDKLYNRYPVHRFIYECFNGKIEEKLQIDHINGIKTDNSIKNLQALNPKDHNNKTFKNSNSRKLQASKLQKKILLSEVNNNGVCISKTIYNCAEDLIPILKLSKITICRYARNKGEIENYKLSYIESDLENEIWKKIDDDLRFIGYEFSNLGRVKNLINKITIGNLNNDGYYEISINRYRYRIHYLICLAFNGKPIGSYGNEITVDHIDRNKLNNKSSNLKWATRIEQATNTIKVKKVRATNVNTNEIIGVYNSASDASRIHNIDKSYLAKLCKRESNISGRLTSKPIKWEYI
jgi:hypothetical protein